MSAATLLNVNDPSFAFDHDQMHRTMTNATVPGVYKTMFLDPVFDPQIPAGFWNGDHAQAHQDFASVFGSIYWPSTVSIVGLNLTTGPTEEWALSNRVLHNLAATALPTSE